MKKQKMSKRKSGNTNTKQWRVYKLGMLVAINTEIIKAREEGIIMLHEKIIKNRASRLKIKWGMG